MSSVPSLGRLRYLYCGSKNVEEDLKLYTEGLGAELLWKFEYSGTTVGAVRLGIGPDFLLADHRPAPSVLPIWEVDDLKTSENLAEKSGFKVIRKAEVPDGPVLLLQDPAGNELALLQVVRPGAPEGMAKSFREGSGEDG
ncbi:MAG: VOC family protein [Actinomycetota bacterium]